MSVVSFRNNSRASSARSLRSNRSSNRSFNDDDFSSSRSRSPSSSSSFSSELGSVQTDSRSLLSIRTTDFLERPKSSSINGSNIFLKKPPIFPAHKKTPVETDPQEELAKQQQQKPINLNLNDDNSSIFSESTDLNTPKPQNPIVPIEKIVKCEENIKRLLNEYEILKNNDELNAKEILENILDEHIGLMTLILVSYGESHISYAQACYKIAEFYLEHKNYPKQAKKHCENGLDTMKQVKANKTNSDIECNQVYMGLYYVIGRAYTILKKNSDGMDNLEKCENYFKEYEKTISSDVSEWKKKIYIGLAKQNAISENYSTALVYYDNALEAIGVNDILRVDLLQDEAKIRKSQENYDEAVKILEDAIIIAETNNNTVKSLECKLELAGVYASSSNFGQMLKAKDLYKECIDCFKKESSDEKAKSKYLESIDEYIKYLIKQNDGYDEAIRLLKQLIHKKKEFIGDYDLEIDSYYKLLSSMYLKKNDMPSAALCLKKCIEIEEMNYGPTSKFVTATKESFENLKKNPSVMQVLNIKKPTELPKFSSGAKIDHRKHDLQIYKPKDVLTTESLNESKKSELNFSTLSKKIAPVK